MPVGGIHGGILGDRESRTGSRSAGGSKSLGNATNGIGSANAAIGTYSRSPAAQEAAYGGMLDAGFGAKIGDALIGALPFINRTTKVNPVSGFTESNYTGGLLDGLGSIFGGFARAPGLGMLGGWADNALGTNVNLGTHTYGEGWGGQKFGGEGGYSGAPGMGGTGRFGPMGFGMRGPAAQPGVSASPASTGAPPGTLNSLSFAGAMQHPSANFGLLNGYSANTRFGQGNLGAVPWGG